MAQGLDVLGILHQNLLDAGCNEEIIEQCMTLAQEKKQADILPVLSKHRAELLKTIHARQRQIDCLDFLVYSVQKDLRASDL